MDEILDRIHHLPPVDTRFVAGRWHKDRVALGGYPVEGRVFLRSLLASEVPMMKKFLIIGRARSGTTLLGQLLNSHSQITCDGEVLKRNVWAPVGFLNRLARKSGSKVYGAKLLSYQMVQVHRFRDPVSFLSRLDRRGFQFIHLTRGTFAQTLSLAVAQATTHFHSDRGNAKGRSSIRLNPEDFLKRIAWSDALLKYEKRCLAEIPHLAVSYEDDLLPKDQQNSTVARICDWIGVSPEAVSTPLRKILSDDPKQIIENYDEVASALRAAKFGHLL